ncbi:MAG: RlpA-like double-psi beta-barrel domain-containing protein [Acidobacteriota bacterium]|nr:RlpA-like double-psi beta-barrel domain-containing protein [Acidobacteriota bacterium]
MRARRNLRATGATRTGAMTMAAAALVLGSASAGALAAQSGSRPDGRSPRGSDAPDARIVIAHSRLFIRRGHFASPPGRTLVVHGLLEPSRRGATVKLLALRERRWHTLATARTHRNGRFRIRYRVRDLGAMPIRVSYPGSRRAHAASADAGRIVALSPAVASWYYDAGNTACGFHATYGIASRTLACGTKVTLAYGGRTLVATVDDRGPYVYGRTFDLNQNTARYLGMWGVGTVFASI